MTYTEGRFYWDPTVGKMICTRKVDGVEEPCPIDFAGEGGGGADGFENPATEDLDMKTYKVKSSNSELRFASQSGTFIFQKL